MDSSDSRRYPLAGRCAVCRPVFDPDLEQGGNTNTSGPATPARLPDTVVAPVSIATVIEKIAA